MKGERAWTLAVVAVDAVAVETVAKTAGEVEAVAEAAVPAAAVYQDLNCAAWEG